jgi:hypothetical protein
MNIVMVDLVGSFDTDPEYISSDSSMSIGWYVCSLDGGIIVAECPMENTAV